MPHPHRPHPDYAEHPWRLLPTALAVIVLLAVVLTVASFAISKWLTGQAY